MVSYTRPFLSSSVLITSLKTQKTAVVTGILRSFSAGLYPLDTLAQNETRKPSSLAVFVQGKGTDLFNIKAIRNRARRKLITQSTVFGANRSIQIRKPRGIKAIILEYFPLPE